MSMILSGVSELAVSYGSSKAKKPKIVQFHKIIVKMMKKIISKKNKHLRAKSASNRNLKRMSMVAKN